VSAGVRRTSPRGFTVIELLLSIAIVAILATISINEFKTQVMLARRTEAVAGLGTLWVAQQEYYSATGRYAATFQQLGTFEVAGGSRLSSTSYKGGRYTYQLSQPWGSTSYYCIATAQLDADPWPDILEVYEFGE
jgi:prepilin-type N-terminal cleavage/methylation domain-containing protein